MDCSEENSNNQRFDIKYMGDTQNCNVKDDVPEIQRVNPRQNRQGSVGYGGGSFMRRE